MKTPFLASFLSLLSFFLPAPARCETGSFADALFPFARFWNQSNPAGTGEDFYPTDLLKAIAGYSINTPPFAQAGKDQTVTIPTNAIYLDGLVVDDGLPRGMRLRTVWSAVSGPEGTWIATPSSADTVAVFSEPNTYVLRLTADDGHLSASDEVTVTVVGEPLDVNFSASRGFYETPFLLTLSSTSEGTSILYTTDGALPTRAAGRVYTGPIEIDGTSTIRAIAVKAHYLDSPVETHTYIFLAQVLQQPALPEGFPETWGGPPSSNLLIAGDYEVDPEIVQDPAYTDRLETSLTSIPSLSLVMDTEDWFSPETGIYSNGAREGIDWERAVSAELLFPDGAQGFAVDTGIRIQGGSSAAPSWKSPKLSMRLLFKSEYGPSKLEYPLFPDSAVSSFNTLVLDARLNQTWIHPNDPDQRIKAQYIRDQFMNDMQNAMGHLSPHGRYIHLYLNGLYWGLYDIHERPDDAFLEEYLGGDRADYDVLRHNAYTIVAGNSASYFQMFAFARGDIAAETTYETLKQYLDVVPFMDYILLNLWAGNTDWAHQNWYAGRNRKDGPGFRYYSWDAEHVLKRVNENVLYRQDTWAPTELFHLLRQNDEFALQFAGRVHKHLFNDGFLTPDRAREIYDRRAAEIDTAIIMESARWGDHRRDHNPWTGGYDLYARDIHWMAELNRLHNEYFPQRNGIVLNQLKQAGYYPSLDAPVFEINGLPQHGGTIQAGDVLTIVNPNQSGTLYYTLDGQDPRSCGGALEYSAPVVLSQGTLVKSSVFAEGEWSALSEATFTAGPPLGFFWNEIPSALGGTRSVGSRGNADAMECVPPVGWGKRRPPEGWRRVLIDHPRSDSLLCADPPDKPERIGLRVSAQRR